VRDIAEERALAAERRADIARRDAELRRVSENATDLAAKLQDTEARLRASEISRANSEEQLSRAMREAADARAEVRSLRTENDRLQSEIDRLTRENKASRDLITRLQGQYESASSELSKTSSKVEEMERAERERREAETRRRDFAELQSQLSKIVTVRPLGDTFVVILPDNFFVANQPALALRVKAKMDALGETLAAHKDVMFTIEGHSDAKPTAESFALGRAQSVADYIAAYGVSRTNFKVESRGATVPLSKRKTASARSQNRRVEIVFVAPQ
jgi:outer membrane protein OmpA-like peptidoglycan-associated protein